MNKIIGTVGLVATALWTAGIVLQFTDFDKTSSAYQAGDVLIGIGFAGLAAFIVGLLVAGVAGRGTFAKIALGVWAFGHLSIPIAAVVESATGNADNPFYPIGGLGQILGGIASAVVIARAGVWTGWKRWAPTAWVVTYLGVFATLFDTSGDPPLILIVPFLLWLGAIAATSVAEAATPAPAVTAPLTA
jgi:hypothetical protein